MTEARVGDAITVDTPWTGDINDRTWFTAPEYAPYRQAGQVKVPFWLQPEVYYVGASWVQRDIDIPHAWAGKRITLTLERAHWQTQVWLDGNALGANDSLSTPHVYDLGLGKPGRRRLTIRIDNRMIVDIGSNSHAITDHTQGNWNGIVGTIALTATAPIWIDDLQIYPQAATHTIAIKGAIGNRGGKPDRGMLEFSIGGTTMRQTTTWTAEGGTFSGEWTLDERLGVWDEFTPTHHEIVATLVGHDRVTRTFGLRSVAVDGTQFVVNGRKTFLRGTLECCIFPKTGHPPTEISEWRRILTVAKAFGLNLIRFHSYCPPEAAFAAADQIGLYLQVETCWANYSTSLGDGKPVERWIYDETERILRAYGNHPSFLLMASGNEPGGKNAATFLGAYVKHFRDRDPRRLWTSSSGWPQIPENQFHVALGPRLHHGENGRKPRLLDRPPETATDYRDYVAARTVPVISHEVGQWCVYPNFAEIEKYTGPLKPKNFEIFRDRLQANGLSHLAPAFLQASGKLQLLCYKEDIESLLRTEGMGGFELLDVHDFPGQGTALVGVLDPFWEEKGYATAAQYRRFCNAVVPLARLSKRVFTAAETLQADVLVANFSAQALRAAVVKWTLTDDRGGVFARGDFPVKDIPIGNAGVKGRIAVDLALAGTPARYRLTVALTAAGSTAENDWDLWVYPTAPKKAARGVLLTSRFDAQAERLVTNGGSVLLTLPGKAVRNPGNAPVKLGFSSIFWNTSWMGRQMPTTLGLLCDPQHPALGDFPTDAHSNWQWWYVLQEAGALRLDTLPVAIEPIVRVIDDWVTARSLGLLVEAQVGKGRLIVCGRDLTEDAVRDPVCAQMRASLLRYMQSPAFRPAATLSPDQVRTLTVPAAEA